MRQLCHCAEQAGAAITFVVVEPLEHVADERICLGLTVLPAPALHDPEAGLAVAVRGAVQAEADGGQLPLSSPLCCCVLPQAVWLLA